MLRLRPGTSVAARLLSGRAFATSALLRHATNTSADALDGVTIVSTREDAERVASVIAKLPSSTYHAWDTEVINIDLSNQSPVGHGTVICASFYSGPNIDYGNGPRVWIDNYGDSKDVLMHFKGVLESQAVRKVWHNYGFDRHVLFNHGIDAKGFGGDTMHMARLWNTALKMRGGYSLEGLSTLLLNDRKVPMKELFSQPRLCKDGTPGKAKVLPPLEEVQTSPDSRSRWIQYSTYDAEATWKLREMLEEKLRERPWINGDLNLFHFYERYLLPFGELLTDMERAGIYVDASVQLKAAEEKALTERAAAEALFLDWAAGLCPDARMMNVASDVQKAHFLFAPCKRVRPGRKTPSSSNSSSAAVKPKAGRPASSSAKKPAASSVADAPLASSPPSVIEHSPALSASSEAVPPPQRKARTRKAPAASSTVGSEPATIGSEPATSSSASTNSASASQSSDATSSSASAASSPAAFVPSVPAAVRRRAASASKAKAAAVEALSRAGGAAPSSASGASRPVAPGGGDGGSSSISTSIGGISTGLTSGVFQRFSQRHFSDALSSYGFRSPLARAFFSLGSAQLSRLVDSQQQQQQQQQQSSGNDSGVSGLDARLGGASRSSNQSARRAPTYYGSSSEDSDSIRSELLDGYSDLDDSDGSIGTGSSGNQGGVYYRYEDYSGDESDGSQPAKTYKETIARRRRIAPAVEVAPAEAEAAPAAAAAVAARDADSWPAERTFQIENTEKWIEPGAKRPKKHRDLVLTGLGIPPVARTESGWPAVNAPVLKILAGKVPPPAPAGAPASSNSSSSKPPPQPQYGTAYDYFGGGADGAAACAAIDALYRISTIDTMLSNFILPLQFMADGQSRVHCSLNLNTETGRLSARRPNLQNQPALEKDRYGVRKAFVAPPGRKLICADYGQLELRLLAHMAKCRSMLDAFSAGGDFHSRTAAGMYPYVQADIDAGKVLLEWDGEGEPPVPLLKNVYATERRKAKVLNFSIAYGKTAMGLSKDWGVSLSEAKETLERWYADRPEVREWQAQVLESARREKCTRTLLGRYRDLPDITSPDVWLRRHSERAAINTPIQGGAADVAMMAMLKLWQNAALKDLGWRMLLQIHDEVILEGPEDTAQQALQLVEADMTQPFAQPLHVQLVVDAKVVSSWYEAK